MKVTYMQSSNFKIYVLRFKIAVLYANKMSHHNLPNENEMHCFKDINFHRNHSLSFLAHNFLIYCRRISILGKKYQAIQLYDFDHELYYVTVVNLYDWSRS